MGGRHANDFLTMLPGMRERGMMDGLMHGWMEGHVQKWLFSNRADKELYLMREINFESVIKFFKLFHTTTICYE